MVTLPATSYPKGKIKVLLLENIHPSAHRLFEADGLQLHVRSGALSDVELKEAISDVHVLGIRSKTQVRADAIEQARRLLAVGCFCIGTNQVDLAAANARGIPVFNAPFSNTRSVAELVISEIIGLARHLGDRSREMHQGVWSKVAKGCYEVRGKTLGIVGYGRIGRQVGVLAELFGMRVLFHDVVQELPMGNNKPVATLEELLGAADFVTLHVPETPQTQEMIGAAEIAQMKSGAYLLNLSRGSVVVIPALAAALRDGKLAGAAIDVFPEEPKDNKQAFVSELREVPNVILTPHVGGSTEEAQEAIGREVATALLKFVNSGATAGAVNFPRIDPPTLEGRHRILNVHQNVPGVLSKINGIISDMQANVEGQILATDAHIGYLVMDLNKAVSDEINSQLAALDTTIKTRILY